MEENPHPMDITIEYARGTDLRRFRALLHDVCARVGLSRAFGSMEPMPDERTQGRVFGDDGLFAYMLRNEIRDFGLTFYEDITADGFIITSGGDRLTYFDIRLEPRLQDMVLGLIRDHLGEWDRILRAIGGAQRVGSMPARYLQPTSASAGPSAGAGVSEAGGERAADREALDLSVPVPPTPLDADGEVYLVYELHLRNLTGETVWLHQVDVVDADGGVMAAFAGDDLTSAVGYRGPDLHLDKTRELVFEPEMLTSVFIWLPTSGKGHRQLTHRVAFSAGPRPATRPSSVVIGGHVAPQLEPPLVLGPPVSAGTWIVHGCHHVDGGWYPIDGELCMAQRYAADWMKLGPDGTLAHGDPRAIENWYGQGAELLAVADGVVSRACDDVPEPGSGCYVVLDLGGGNSASYVHLEEGSVCVRDGERVSRGQPVGRLGNSGAPGLRPHLHFHVAHLDSPFPSDARAPFVGDGVPFVLESFQLQGYFQCTQALVNEVILPHDVSSPRSGESGVRRHHEYPLHSAVVAV